jgi:hypothetical protein
MNISLKRQTLHAYAREVAAFCYYKHRKIPSRLIAIIRATESDEALLKYSPDQPRVPAGNPDGGQWTSGGEGEESEDNIYSDAIKPVYPIETFLAALSSGSVFSTVRYLLGGMASDVVSDSIQDAAQSIEDYLGGQPDDVIKNPAGDIILMRGDKKIRFDIFDPGNDEPHFHIEEKPENGGKWLDSGNSHRYYFKQ